MKFSAKPVFPFLTIALGVAAALPVQAANRLEEVIVTSSRIEIPFKRIATSVTVLDAEDIQLRGYASVADVLRTQPGIGVSNSGGAGKATTLRIRGEEGYRTKVLIDGVDIADPTGTQVIPQFEHLASTSEIERVEILRGPQGFSYGADAGGVVNIFTRTGSSALSGQVAAEAGRYGSQKVNGNIGGGNDQFDYVLAASQAETDGFNSRPSDTLLRDNDGYENTTLHSKLGWNPNAKTRLQLVVRDVAGDSDYDRCGFPSTDNCRFESDQTTARLSGDYKGDAISHLLAYSHTDVERSSLAAGFADFKTDGSRERFEYTGSVNLMANSQLVFGADLDEEEITTSSGDDLDRDQLGLYTEWLVDINDLHLSVGARHDDNDDFGEHTSYRASASYVQSLANGDSFKYRASYGTGFRAPSLSEIAYNHGPYAYSPATDAELGEETSKGYELGWGYFSARGFAEVIYFDQTIEDILEFDLVGYSGYVQTDGESDSSGVELIGELVLDDQWTLQGNFTHNDTQGPDGLTRVRRPQQLMNLGVRFNALGDKLALVANYRVSRDSEDLIFGVGRVPLDNYEVLDVSGSYQVTELVQVYARVENALDKDYVEVTGYNTPGAAAHAGLRVSF